MAGLLFIGLGGGCGGPPRGAPGYQASLRDHSVKARGVDHDDGRWSSRDGREAAFMARVAALREPMPRRISIRAAPPPKPDPATDAGPATAPEPPRAMPAQIAIRDEPGAPEAPTRPLPGAWLGENGRRLAFTVWDRRTADPAPVPRGIVLMLLPPLPLAGDLVLTASLRARGWTVVRVSMLAPDAVDAAALRDFVDSALEAARVRDPVLEARPVLLVRDASVLPDAMLGAVLDGLDEGRPVMESFPVVPGAIAARHDGPEPPLAGPELVPWLPSAVDEAAAWMDARAMSHARAEAPRSP